MNIKTAPHPSGRKIVAKGGGKQRTVEIDPERSQAYNHGAAAGTLLAAIGGFTAADTFTHEQVSETVHKFTAEVFN